MTDVKILLKAIEKAEKNGWKNELLEYIREGETELTSWEVLDGSLELGIIGECLGSIRINDILFDHKFWESLVGDEIICEYTLKPREYDKNMNCVHCGFDVLNVCLAQLKHNTCIQQCALSEDRIKYLEQFINYE